MNLHCLFELEDLFCEVAMARELYILQVQQQSEAEIIYNISCKTKKLSYSIKYRYSVL